MTPEQIGKLKINPTAKYVATIMGTTGVIDTRRIAEITGLTMRSVQRAKNEYADACVTSDAHDGDKSDIGVTGDATRATSASLVTLSPAPRVHAPAQMESPSGIDSPKLVEDTPLAPKVDQLGRPIEGPEAEIFFEEGKLHLVASQRKFWLKKFDCDESRLDLALIEIAPKLLPHGRQPIFSQVGSQLARIAGLRHDQQKRYEAAKAAPRMSQAQAQAERARELMRLTA